jgi:predicted DsbA family dithiol-disulfide isomerase
VISEMMRSYFKETDDITSWDMLANAATKAGLEKGDVRKWLEEGKGSEEVDMQVEQGIGGNHGNAAFLDLGEVDR